MSKLQLETCKSLFSSWLVKWYLNRLVTALINTTWSNLGRGERSLIETCERSGVNRYHDWGESAPLLCSYTTAQPLPSHSGSYWLTSAKISAVTSWFKYHFTSQEEISDLQVSSWSFDILKNKLSTSFLGMKIHWLTWCDFPKFV